MGESREGEFPCAEVSLSLEGITSQPGRSHSLRPSIATDESVMGLPALQGAHLDAGGLESVHHDIGRRAWGGEDHDRVLGALQWSRGREPVFKDH